MVDLAGASIQEPTERREVPNADAAVISRISGSAIVRVPGLVVVLRHVGGGVSAVRDYEDMGVATKVVKSVRSRTRIIPAATVGKSRGQ